MQLSDTIFALSTATGKSGVAIVRISGENVQELFGTVVPKETSISPREAIYTPFIHPDTQESIDIGLCLYFPAPHSFTGEDVVEFHVHGSIAVLKKLFSILGNLRDFRPAEAGEFSRRAFVHGKFDLTQAESLIDLIDAETEHQRRAALANTRGALYALYSSWQKDLRELCAYCEACLDFPDEDLPSTLEAYIQSQCQTLLAQIEAHLQTAPQGSRLRLGTKVAIIGPSNAGKSTLLNHYAQYQAAITSPIAGTTRDSIEQHIDIAGYAVNLIDTAGLQETEDLIEKQGIERTKQLAETADLILLMFDGSQPIKRKKIFTDYIKTTETIIIINKIDQGFRPENSNIITKYYNNVPRVDLSLSEEIGLKTLDSLLLKTLQKLAGNSHTPLIMHTRYQQALEKCRTDLNEALKTLNCVEKNSSCEKNIELISEILRQSLNAIGQITGHSNVEDLLDIVFSRFCIGK